MAWLLWKDNADHFVTILLCGIYKMAVHCKRELLIHYYFSFMSISQLDIWLMPHKNLSLPIFFLASLRNSTTPLLLPPSVLPGSDHVSPSTLLSVFSSPTFWLMSFKYPSVPPISLLRTFPFFPSIPSPSHNPTPLHLPLPPIHTHPTPRPHHFPAAAAGWAGADQTGEPGCVQQGTGTHTQTGFPRCHPAR